MSVPRPVALSALESAPVWSGMSPADSIRELIEVAQALDHLGYQRLWVAEHHNTARHAASAPDVLISRLGVATSRIRVGAGGLIFDSRPALTVAEQFATLEILYPGRIDLAIDHARLVDPLSWRALRHTAQPLSSDEFPERLSELMSYLYRVPPLRPAQTIDMVPRPDGAPEVWLIGASTASARVAGALGLPFAYAHHLNPTATTTTLRAYRNAFRPGPLLRRPHVMISALVAAADTDERAAELALPGEVAALEGRIDRTALFHDPAEASRYPLTARRRRLIQINRETQIVGGPATVSRRLRELLAETDADEILAITLIREVNERIRSFELLREATCELVGH